MKLCVHMLLGLVIIGLAAHREARTEETKSDFEGTWTLVSFERDGKETKLEKETNLVSTGNKFVVKREGKVVVSGTFKFDTTTKPKSVDVTYTEGPDKDKTFKGIYEIDGETA